MDPSIDSETAMKLLADEYKYVVIRLYSAKFLGPIFPIRGALRFSIFLMTLSSMLLVLISLSTWNMDPVYFYLLSRDISNGSPPRRRDHSSGL